MSLTPRPVQTQVVEQPAQETTARSRRTGTRIRIRRRVVVNGCLSPAPFRRTPGRRRAEDSRSVARAGDRSRRAVRRFVRVGATGAAARDSNPLFGRCRELRAIVDGRRRRRPRSARSGASALPPAASLVHPVETDLPAAVGVGACPPRGAAGGVPGLSGISNGEGPRSGKLWHRGAGPGGASESRAPGALRLR